MHKMIIRGVFAPPPSTRALGFGVAAFTCAPGKPADGEMPRFPANSPLGALPHGRTS